MIDNVRDFKVKGKVITDSSHEEMEVLEVPHNPFDFVKCKTLKGEIKTFLPQELSLLLSFDTILPLTV